MIRAHPETGRPSLFVNPLFTMKIDGLRRAESDALLDMLYEVATRPEHQMRWHWSAGDVAFWDNRCTMHYALLDYGKERRRMERVALEGDRPVGDQGAVGLICIGSARGAAEDPHRELTVGQARLAAVAVARGNRDLPPVAAVPPLVQQVVLRRRRAQRGLDHDPIAVDVDGHIVRCNGGQRCHDDERIAGFVHVDREGLGRQLGLLLGGLLDERVTRVFRGHVPVRYPTDPARKPFSATSCGWSRRRPGTRRLHSTRRNFPMGLGTSIFLIAVGAILKFAVNWQVNEVDLQAVGVILMVIGALGLVLSLIFWNSWGGFGRREVVVDGGTRRRVVRDEYVD